MTAGGRIHKREQYQCNNPGRQFEILPERYFHFYNLS